MVKLTPPPSLSIKGTLVKLDFNGNHLLVVGACPREMPSLRVAKGPMTLRFGMALLYENDHILPQLVIDDFGYRYPGEAGIEFLLEKGDRYPRGDVFGSRVSTRLDEHMFVKQLDLARGVVCFASARNQSETYRVGTCLWIEEGLPDIRPVASDDPRATPLMRQSTRCLVGPAGQSFVLPHPS